MESAISNLKALPPLGEHEASYAGFRMSSPALVGLPLKIMTALADTPLFIPIRSHILYSNNIPQLLDGTLHIPDRPLFAPSTDDYRTVDIGADQFMRTANDNDAAEVVEEATQRLWGNSYLSPPAQPSTLPSIMDYHRAYMTGASSPSQVAESIIAALEASEAQTPPMKFLTAYNADAIRAAATASDLRYRMENVVSFLDGVPFVVKDIIDVEGFQTTSGTAFMGPWRGVCQETSECVKGLLAAGAILIGKANTHELGIGTTGLNAVTGTPRNPHNRNHHTGGSSSGSAAIVAAGLCPFAIGSDGGGSIRIPSSLCGVVGLKVTHNRICNQPHPPGDHTLPVVGPIAATVRDAALVYSVMANRGHAKRGKTQPPAVLLPDLRYISEEDTPLKDRKVGVYWPWFKDCEQPQVVETCRAAVEYLESKGAEIVSDIVIPELHFLAPAHVVTIATEILNSVASAVSDPLIRSTLNADTRLSLALARGFSSSSYVQAQKVRRRMTHHFRQVFEHVDFLVTPTTPCTAPAIRPEALVGGESNLAQTASLMRFTQAANLLGLPGLSVPVGVVDGLPVGLQIMSGPWGEAGLFMVGTVLEGMGGAVRAKGAFWDVLYGRQ